MINAPSVRSTPITAPFTALACLFCVAVFAALGLSGDDTSWATAEKWGYFPDSAIWEGKPWALITSTFVHLEILHIAFNLYWLWFLGSCFEETLGWMRWLLFFVAAAWVSSAFQLLLGGESGIGMSGVGYALFGFAWVARRKLPRFADIMDDQTVRLFLGWLVLCIVLTNLDVMPIANWAHIFGLAFGASIGALFILRWRPWVPATGLALLLVISMVPLKWCPLSADWTGLQAAEAHEKLDYPAAINWYQRSLSTGQDPAWVWMNLASIYAAQEKQAEYSRAVQELRTVDAESAKEVEADYGAPVAATK